MTRGRVLTFLMLAMGLAAALYAVWFNNRQGRKVIAALSPATADAIAHAMHAELMMVDDAQTSATAEPVQINGRQYAARQRRNLAGARGYVNFRAALLRDASYDWSLPVDGADGKWQYLAIFSDGPKQVRLAFDLHGKRVALLDGGPVLSIAPVADGLAAFFTEQSAEGQPAP